MTASVDQELVAAASDAVRRAFRPGWHFVGAALRSTDGTIHTGVNLQAYVTRISVCAEPIALGQVVLTGDVDLVQAVAVHQTDADAAPRVCSPCGMCRELLADYAPDLDVVVPNGDTPIVVPIGELLPNKYRRG